MKDHDQDTEREVEELELLDNETRALRCTSRDGDAHPYRDNRGLFKKGNPGGPGNSAAKNGRLMKRAMATAVTPAEVVALLRKFYDLAMNGDIAAGKVVLDRVAGRATGSLGALLGDEKLKPTRILIEMVGTRDHEPQDHCLPQAD